MGKKQIVNLQKNRYCISKKKKKNRDSFKHESTHCKFEENIENMEIAKLKRKKILLLN